MKKKNYRKKNNYENRKKIIDMSERQRLTVGNIDIYDDQELQDIIEEINKQILLVEKQYYSSNDLIERIIKRNFVDIIREKWSSILKKKDYLLEKFEKNFAKL